MDNMSKKLAPAVKRELKRALFVAVGNDDMSGVRRLLGEGADPDAIDQSDGYTPLNLAIEKRHLDIARVLLEAGAAPVRGIVDNMEEAIEDKNVELVQLLLAHGADPDGGTPKRIRVMRPLMEAARVGSMKIVEVLLAAGADKTLQNEMSYTAMDIAKEKGFPRIAAKLRLPEQRKAKGRRLLSKEDVTAIKRAIQRGSVATVKKLAAGKELDCYLSEMNTSPLVFAIWREQPEIIKTLLELGATISFGTGEFPLEAAARGGDLTLMDLLVGLGADVNQRVPGGATALTSAIQQEKVESVKWLLDHGADPHSKDQMGRTAWDIMLEWEASIGKPSPCRPLLPPP